MLSWRSHMGWLINLLFCRNGTLLKCFLEKILEFEKQMISLQFLLNFYVIEGNPVEITYKMGRPPACFKPELLEYL